MSAEIRRYWLVLALSGFILILEAVGGWFSGSLALFSDAVHVFADIIAIAISLIVAYTVKNNQGLENKIRQVGARRNGILLALLSIWIFWEALNRIWKPQEIQFGIMFWVAVSGAILNYCQHKILGHATHEERHVTHQALDWHILSDLIQSLAVILASVLIYITGQTVIDSVLSIIVALVMFRWSIKLLQSK